ncbi:MAG: type IV pili twitching motility protein PilT [Candidatus Yanofskybacteria bacterium RIFCSPHIGHO2_02_FULL_46_19]|uniref:Type IV pili twitching motility protein PilT n=1 Tax=Candidatus Yanofskybacteria bacterium RIFCSPHIGHO2_02_FULL_46_19 TaxID=1802684 RepID=A0A1F8FQY2_9BACT|nr:MAG: type IV pili twitching motility protein PilT [Candidatus Yanofskybacteria bacterium RIFCSPHIGHO2_02_FULL_46_19]
MDYKQYLEELLLAVPQQGASDLHLSPGHYPALRVSGRLVMLGNKPILDQETLNGMVLVLLGDKKDRFVAEKELDFSYSLNPEVRFRVNVYQTQGFYATTLRFIPQEIQTIEELGLPPVIKIFSKLSQGLVLIVGPNGHGKSTTVAVLLNEINKERAEKIITVEDPIEYILSPDKSIVNQRELFRDTNSFEKAIWSSVRQNANVIMIGELRDYPTMAAALSAAETGHLVFASLNTGSAVQSIERIVYSFPADQQNQARSQIASTIAGVVSQRLIPRIKGGLIPAAEVLIATPAVRSLINDNRMQQLEMVMDTGYDIGMISLDRSLADLVRRKEITLEQAEFHSLKPMELRSMAR